MAMHYSTLPVMLTIAGSDSGGGAGIQADLKTFAALGTYGASALTAITAQNPEEVTAIQPVDPKVVEAQVRAVGSHFAIGAVKTGMLFSEAVIEAVAGAYADLKPAPDAPGDPERPPLVVDPVMVATSGATLLNDDAIGALESRILPLATVVTPNMAEAAILARCEVSGEAHLAEAARAIHERFGVPALVKGGHLADSEDVVDCLFDGKEIHTYRDSFILGVNTHGTGCTLSAALAVYLMRGLPLPDAVTMARAYLRQTLANALPVGGIVGLNHGFAPIPLEMV